MAFEFNRFGGGHDNDYYYGSDSESPSHGGFRGEDAYASGGHGGYENDQDSDDDKPRGAFSEETIRAILAANGRNPDGSEAPAGSLPSPRPNPRPLSRTNTMPARSVDSPAPSEDFCHHCGSVRPRTLNRANTFAPHMHSSNGRPQSSGHRSQSYSGPSGRPGSYSSGNFTPPSSSHSNYGRRASHAPRDDDIQEWNEDGPPPIRAHWPEQPQHGNISDTRCPPSPPLSASHGRGSISHTSRQGSVSSQGVRGSVSYPTAPGATNDHGDIVQEWDDEHPPAIRAHYPESPPPPQRRTSHTHHNAGPRNEEWDGDEPPPLRTHYPDSPPPPQRRTSHAHHNAGPRNEEWDGDEPPPIRTHYPDSPPPPQRRTSHVERNAGPRNEEWDGDEPPPIRTHCPDSPPPPQRRSSHAYHNAGARN